jgi:hypothetical protein
VKNIFWYIDKHTNSEFITVFSRVCVTRSLVLSVCFVDRCFSFFFSPLCCLSFFDLQILITPLVSSNSSYSFFTFLLTAHVIKGKGVMQTTYTGLVAKCLAACWMHTVNSKTIFVGDNCHWHAVTLRTISTF